MTLRQNLIINLAQGDETPPSVFSNLLTLFPLTPQLSTAGAFA